jgi:hypothetical protein
LHGQLVRARGQDVVQPGRHAPGLFPREQHHAGQQHRHGVRPDAHRGHNTEVPATAAQSPQRVRFVFGVGGEGAAGEHHAGGEQVVQGEPEPAAERTSGPVVAAAAHRQRHARLPRGPYGRLGIGRIGAADDHCGAGLRGAVPDVAGGLVVRACGGHAARADGAPQGAGQPVEWFVCGHGAFVAGWSSPSAESMAINGWRGRRPRSRA